MTLEQSKYIGVTAQRNVETKVYLPSLDLFLILIYFLKYHLSNASSTFRFKPGQGFSAYTKKARPAIQGSRLGEYILILT